MQGYNFEVGLNIISFFKTFRLLQVSKLTAYIMYIMCQQVNMQYMNRWYRERMFHDFGFT